MARHSMESRRAFLQKLGALLASGSTLSLLPQLALMPKAIAQSTVDYRALVCIYLAGANDSFNWLVPRDSEAAGSRYDTYRASRGGVYSAANPSGLALAFNELLPIQPANASIAYGLHPSSTDFSVTSGGNSQNHLGLQSLFAQGKAAFVCNVGPLIQPISKAEYEAGAPRPPQLFSHNDQENLWHVGVGSPSHPAARFGWGGRLAKAAGSTLPNGLSPTLSIAGAAKFLIGDGILPFQVSSRGINLIDNYTLGAQGNNFDDSRRRALDDLLAAAQPNVFAAEYAAMARRSLAIGESLSALLSAPDGSGDVQTIFPTGNTLAEQLRIVARLIKISRNSLGARRQVYYVRYGSFDLHQGMFEPGQPAATGGHGALLTALNQAIGAFWSALGEIGARSQVTTFTMSDFGRTLSGNGSGSDHAWGGNLLVLGDAVRGGRLYGKYPQLRLNANDNADSDWSFSRGQYIPTTAVEQVAATLAKWMGVIDNSALDALFPLLGNFAARDLGFMVG
jgi:uncharacterized protein (DUF1501 family)